MNKLIAFFLILLVGSTALAQNATTFRGVPTHTNPTIATSASTTCLAANSSRRMLTIQNNSASVIAISLTGATITSLTPSATNKIILLAATTGTYSCPSSYCTIAAITCYQTSGGNLDTISFVEGLVE